MFHFINLSVVSQMLIDLFCLKMYIWNYNTGFVSG